MVDITPSFAPFRDPARPPTPPKDSKARFSDGIAFSGESLPQALPDTPEESPTSSADPLKSLSVGARKRVKISSKREYHQPSGNRAKGYSSDDLRPLPRSRDCKSTKSILKIAHCTNAEDSGDRNGFDQTSVPSMLMSTNQHLAHDCRSSSLDAYNTLLACLRTYEGIPTAAELNASMADLCRYLHRDISKVCTNTTIDLQLVTPALNIVTLLLGSQGLVESVPDEFKSFVVERSITSLEDSKTPKALLTHYMHCLEKQRLGPKILTADRTHRLLLALDTILCRAKSPRIIGHRLMIYYRLLVFQKARSIMASKIDTWLHHLLMGMLNAIKDIRSRAIAFGMEAGIQLGNISSVSKAFMHMLNQKGPQDKKIMEVLHTRAKAMLRTKEDPNQIPQIWSVMILLLRGQRSKIETWEHFGSWKDVVFSCLEGSDIHTRIQALLAVNRLVYVVNIDTISTPMANELQELMLSQLQPKSHEKPADKRTVMFKQSSRSTYCTLLYYALHPAASHAQLDKYWQLFVAEILPIAFSTSTTDVDYACEVVASLLFNEGPPCVWNEKKASTSGPVLTTDLPSLDPKWIKSRAGKIIATVEVLSDRADWQPTDGKDAPIAKVWRHFISAIGSASSKEIKVSSETVAALAHILNQFKRRLDRPTGEGNDSADSVRTVHHMVETVISKLGDLALNEKRISFTTQNGFEPVLENPSSRLRGTEVTMNSASFHLLRLLLDSREFLESPEYVGLLSKLTQVHIQTPRSRIGKLSALRGIAGLCVSDGTPPSFTSHLWNEVASDTVSILKSQRPPEKAEQDTGYLGRELREVSKVLEVGLSYLSTTTNAFWNEIFDTARGMVVKEVGFTGVTMALTEPLSKVVNTELESRIDELLLETVTKLLDNAYLPPSNHTFARTQTQLWGEVRQRGKMPVAGLPDEFYSMVIACLQQTYSNMLALPPNSVQRFLAAFTSFVHNGSPSSRIELLGKVQAGPAVWFRDAKGALETHCNIFGEVRKLWAVTATIVEKTHEPSSDLLMKVHDLITAGLRSRHRAILNDAVVLWNETFGCAESLEYTTDLRRALLKIKTISEICIPGLPMDQAQGIVLSPFRFVDDVPNAASPVNQTPPGKLSHQVGHSSHPKNTPILGHLHTSVSTKKDDSPQTSSRRSRKTTPKARLRHDDSQVQFAAIESSPLAQKEVDSQALTDRQKETRNRQMQDAAMFPELLAPSSVSSKGTNQALPRLVLKTKESLPVHPLNADEETSPTFPSDDVLNGVLGSSPTPNSSRRRSEERDMDDDLPSSPPLVPAQLRFTRSESLSPPSSSNGSRTAPRASQLESLSQTHVQHVTMPQENPEGFTREALNVETTSPEEFPSTNEKLRSDLNSFIDAHSDPQPSSEMRGLAPSRQAEAQGKEPSNVCEGSSINENALSSRAQGPSMSIAPFETERHIRSEQSLRLSTEDEQVQAQILAEIQGVQSAPDESRDAGRNGRKRKASQNNTCRDRKRLAKNSQSRSETNNHLSLDEVAADCVLVDSRPSHGLFQSVSPEKEPTIKQERSASPPGIVASVVEQDDHGVRRRRFGQAPSSERLRRSSREQAPVRRSGRKLQIKREKEEGTGMIVAAGGQQRRLTDASDFSRESCPSADRLPKGSGMFQQHLDLSGSLANPGRSRPGRSESEADSGVPTAGSILEGYRRLLGELQEVVLQSEEERAILGMIFRSGIEAQEAGQRRANG